MKFYRFSITAFTILALGMSCGQKADTPQTPSAQELNERIQDQSSMKITELDPEQQDYPPAIRASTLNGPVFDLRNEQGKVVVLNFWGTWCGPCIAEMPDFIELQSEFGRDKLVFAGISTPNAPPDSVNRFITDMGVNYPIIYDQEAKIEDSYSPPAWPSTFLIGRDGKVKKIIIGSTNKGLLRPELEALLAES